MSVMDTDTVEIGLVGESDIGDITGLLNHEIAHGFAHFGSVPEREETIRGLWKSHHETHAWLVARDGEGRFLGFAKSAPWSARGAYSWCVEVSIYIAPGAQRMGLGKRLYGRLFEILGAQGYVTVIAGASVPNEGSDRLHKAMGMKVIGEHESIGYKFGRWYGVRYYQGFLRAKGSEPGVVVSVEKTLGSLEK